MSAGDPYLAMTNQVWEDPGIDRLVTKQMERRVRNLRINPAISLATSALRRLGAPRTVRPILIGDEQQRHPLAPAALPACASFRRIES